MAASIFAKVPSELDFPGEERAILRFWREERIFEKTLAKPAPKGPFVFYEGPPTANGLPHNGHVLTRVIKDIFPRYRTMRGWSVPRKAGWDTHGLPVEVEVEKELRLHGKAAIEEYGVEPFIKKCIESVFRYTREWEELTERVAFWADLEDAYVTYHRSYVESVWWALAELYKKGLLYQGHKVVWWWAQGGTALSAGEVGQGYKTVDDPSVYVAFPLAPATSEGSDVWQADASLLVWTTTPWTLPSNMYAAVNPNLDYVVIKTAEGRRFVVAQGLVETLGKKLGGALSVERTMKGRDLVGLAYKPPFDLFVDQVRGFEDAVWRIIAADFVTIDAGTGIVHIAPAFGEDDHEAHRRLMRGRTDLPLLCAVDPDGTFIARFERYAGRWVKDCDKEISHDLKDAGLLVHAEQYRHDYPFCWRADTDPLIQYARPAWYIRTTDRIGDAIANNQKVQWLPDHIKDGRFGDFLANNVDWALSRERWWGTPLNVWICDADPEHKEALPCIADIERRNPHAFDHFHAARRADPSLSEHLIVHKPWIDQVTVPCAQCSTEGRPAATMHRVPEVIDCWFDSGCMPFAQWGYPHAAGSKDLFEKNFPADFISEAIDQTRGWFYSLLMVSTLVFEKATLPHPYKTCIVLGHVSDKEGKKESKSKGNYTPPEIILDEVSMDFAVLTAEQMQTRMRAARQVTPAAADGWVILSVDDRDGLDLPAPTPNGPAPEVHVTGPGGTLALQVREVKGLPRRVLLLSEGDQARLGVHATSNTKVLPVEVPRLPPDERVRVLDPSTPAPGADAFRWFFYASSPPWSATRHSLSNVRALQKDFAVKLRNVYSFFTIYASIDGFDPNREMPFGLAAQPELDRWIRSELALTVRDVTAAMDAFDVYGATQKLITLVDALSNWWVRRSRVRFWRSGWDAEKRSAYETLYACLVTVAKLTAPFTPFGAESMWRNLVVRARPSGAVESVHLADWPAFELAAVDETLSRKIAAVRALVSLGLQVRTQAKLKVRQPLGTAFVLVADEGMRRELATAGEMIREELNVLSFEVVAPERVRDFVEYKIKPNFRTLGQRGLGKQAQELKKAMGALSADEAASVVARLDALGTSEFATVCGVELLREDVEVAFETQGTRWAAAGDRAGVVVLDTNLTDELRDLGLLRELLNRVQTARKEMGLEYTDRIAVTVEGSERVQRVVFAHKDAFAAEVLAIDVRATALGGRAPDGNVHEKADAGETKDSDAVAAVMRETDVEGEIVRLALTRAPA